MIGDEERFVYLGHSVAPFGRQVGMTFAYANAAAAVLAGIPLPLDVCISERCRCGRPAPDEPHQPCECGELP